jgi:hypothetical protein
MTMADIKLYGSKGGVGDGTVTLRFGQESTLALVFVSALFLTYILGGIHVLLYVAKPYGSPWVGGEVSVMRVHFGAG